MMGNKHEVSVEIDAWKVEDEDPFLYSSDGVA